ncbi:MAG TPA: hypothetical protein VL242_07605 [Sorangium sp.]|nr:hypothetical protein [Sorangium sp.]
MPTIRADDNHLLRRLVHGELLMFCHRVAAPLAQTARLIREILLFGFTDPGQLAGGLPVLAGWTAATFALSLRLLRWHR